MGIIDIHTYIIYDIDDYADKELFINVERVLQTSGVFILTILG